MGARLSRCGSLLSGSCMACASSCGRCLRRFVPRRQSATRPERESEDRAVELETALVLSKCDNDEESGGVSVPHTRDGFKDEAQSAARVTPIHIDKFMSSPTIRISGGDGGEEDGGGSGRTVSGHGLALAAGPVGQDAAYWEWHMGEGGNEGGVGGSQSGGVAGADHENVMVGVSTKRNPNFYEILAKSDGAASSLKLATKLMRTVRANSEDIIGVAIDLKAPKPLVQLLLNGELQEEFHLGRFRGSVFPSIWLPGPDGTASSTFVHDEIDFQRRSPGPAFLPLAGGGSAGGTGIV